MKENKKRKATLIIRDDDYTRARIPLQNISFEKHSKVKIKDLSKREARLGFILSVNEMSIDNGISQLLIDICMDSRYRTDYLVEGIVTISIPSTAFPPVFVTLKKLLSGFTQGEIIESAIARAIAPDCFLEYKCSVLSKKPELILSYKEYSGEVRFSTEIDITDFILSKGYKDIIIFEERIK